MFRYNTIQYNYSIMHKWIFNAFDICKGLYQNFILHLSVQLSPMNRRTTDDRE